MICLILLTEALPGTMCILCLVSMLVNQMYLCVLFFWGSPTASINDTLAMLKLHIEVNHKVTACDSLLHGLCEAVNIYRTTFKVSRTLKIPAPPG